MVRLRRARTHERLSTHAKGVATFCLKAQPVCYGPGQSNTQTFFQYFVPTLSLLYHPLGVAMDQDPGGGGRCLTSPQSSPFMRS